MVNSAVFTKENLDDVPGKGQSPYRTMPKIYITLNGVIGCVSEYNVYWCDIGVTLPS